MGGKYEVRWKFNGRCPFWCSVFTNSLLRALWLYVKAVCKGNTRVDLVMHAWKECPADCKNREWLCGNNPANLIPLCQEHHEGQQRRRRSAEIARSAAGTHKAPGNGRRGYESRECGETRAARPRPKVSPLPEPTNAVGERGRSRHGI